MKKILVVVLMVFVTVFCFGDEPEEQNILEKLNSIYQEMLLSIENENFNAALQGSFEIDAIIRTLKADALAKDNDLESGDFEKLLEESESPALITIGEDTVLVHYGGDILYVIKDDDGLSYGKYMPQVFGYPFPIEYKDELAIENKYLKIDGITKIVKFQSSDEEILTVADEGTYVIHKEGDVIVTVSIDENYVEIPMRIILLPLQVGMSREEMIISFGLADNVNKHLISYYESEIIDGVFYSAKSKRISVEHWLYNHLPEVVFTFNYDELDKCIMPKWDDVSSIKYMLEHR
jgi:hypothetical protein